MGAAVVIAGLVVVGLVAVRRATRPSVAGPVVCELLDEPAPLYRSRLEAVPQGEQGPALRVVR